MKGSTIKTLAAFLLALLVVIGLGAFFWPTTSQQIPTFRLTPTRVSQTTNTAIPPSPTGVSNQGSTPIPSATLMAIAPKVETVMATIVITATPNEQKASETPTPLPNNGPIVHTVKAGDNMFRLSINYGVSLSALAAANRLRTDAVLKVGQTLVIPSTTNAPPAKPVTTPSVSPNATATKSADITTTLATPVSQVIIVTSEVTILLKDFSPVSVAFEYNHSSLCHVWLLVFCKENCIRFSGRVARTISHQPPYICAV